MRIISGIHRSRIIKMVPSESTRETSDKVRGAVLNSIGDKVKDAFILDLFAGSGAYGLESISRGARKCMFNDTKLDATKTILENIKSLKVEEQSELLKLDYLKAVEKLKNEQYKFDLIFLDPPYKKVNLESLINDLDSILDDDGLIVIETHKDVILSLERTPKYQVRSEKVYGIKKIYYVIKI
ncbi:16S rRNA (guanine(966)-N(2))-methyltransferase RsmD [Acholeplasma equirhinis]|uniref:16S rRNA (guanine(966)-N(2))-methyltransferase RsmD n=1 Tax=Acholeplasma equirhinis TaxID=555393 RepID=UPI00197AFA44|nr:16S rRNA (guanine(966)-N(2))-methyltransferase RsmD [Acholeplasma equirhinis]MBN3490368.1 16S rRNA (guanine(966)-N(2))-methyltransferase RsmD [Acholeplasma equirhinis]